MQNKIKNYIISIESMGDVLESFMALQSINSPIVFITNIAYLNILTKLNKNEYIKIIGINSSNRVMLFMNIFMSIIKPSKIIICHRNKYFSKIIKLFFPFSHQFKLKYPHEKVGGLIYKSTRNRCRQYSMLYRASELSLNNEAYAQIPCIKDNKVAIFAIGGGNKSAPLGARGGKNILSVCKHIKDNYKQIEILYLVGNGADDLKTSKKVENYFTSLKVENLVNKTKLTDIHNYFLKSSMIFSFDSGIMHLSCFYDMNKYFIFGPTNPLVVLPSNYNYNIIGQAGECINCYNPDDGANSPAYKCVDSHCTNLEKNNDEFT